MPTRRDLLVGVSALAVASAASSAMAGAAKTPETKPAGDKPAETKPAETKPAGDKPSGPFTLAALPWADSDLAPVISQNAVSFHYGKHHQGYVNKLNELYVGNESLGTTPDAIAKATYGKADKMPLYNNAAQAWNHAFYWNSMKKNGGDVPTTGKLAEAIKASFGDADGVKKAFKEAALGQFGSGWAWLVNNGGKLSMVKTSNADAPLWTGAGTPLLVIDVWEHAYYLDYQNKRADYVGAWLDKLVNWEFAEKNFG